jgi:hypothetical protein
MILFAERAMDAFDRVIPNVAEMDPGVRSWVFRKRPSLITPSYKADGKGK